MYLALLRRILDRPLRLSGGGPPDTTDTTHRVMGAARVAGATAKSDACTRAPCAVVAVGGCSRTRLRRRGPGAAADEATGERCMRSVESRCALVNRRDDAHENPHKHPVHKRAARTRRAQCGGTLT